MIKNIKFGIEHQQKLLKRYNKYYNKDKLRWEIPQHEMKNIIGECWDLSNKLNKFKKNDLKKSNCPIGLDAPTVCRWCIYGKMYNEDYEYRCNYDDENDKTQSI